MFTNWQKHIPFAALTFIPLFNGKLDIVINKQVIIQIVIVNIAFYVYRNIRLNEVSSLNSFKQTQ